MLAFERHFWKSLPPMALQSFNYLDKEEAEWCKKYFTHSLAYLNVPTYQDAVKIAKQLCHKYNVYFITARPLEFTNLTAHELAKHRLPIKQLIVVKRVDKVDLLDIMIDDESAMVLKALSQKIMAILIRRKWNEGLKTYYQYLEYALKWAEIPDLVEKLLEKRRWLK